MNNEDEEHFKKILNSLNKKDSEFLRFAYDFAEKAHWGQKRKSGEEYFIHPLSVSISLWNKFGDLDLMIAGLLHDTVEDSEELEMGEIYEKFGNEIGFLVDSVTKGEKTFYKSKEEMEDVKDKVIAGGMKDVRCILLKLADRDHNLATLHHMPPHKQVKKSFESQSLYIPLMHILGFGDKEKLEASECDKLFQNYLSKNNLKGYKQIKNNLLNICFNDFNEELFNVVYDNSSNIIWELEDKKLFNELLEDGWFDSEGVKVISIEGDLGDYFKIIFKIIGGIGGNSFSGLKNINLNKSNFLV